MTNNPTSKNKPICSACGTSPVNHKLLFTLDFIEETIGERMEKLFGSFTEKESWERLASFIEKLLYILLSFLGIVKFGQDVEKAVTGRSKLIWEEAKKRSIPMEQVIILGKPVEFYRARINDELFYFHSLPIPPYFKQTGYKWLDDKFKLFEKLSKNGIPVPGAEKFSTFLKGAKAFETLKKPVIIKPKNGSRGRHTTTNINTREEFVKAFNLTKEISMYMIMQEHLFGSVCRGTVINNELVGFFRADPPQITGHDSKTIKELIEEKNKNRHERLSDITINDDLIDFIKRQGYTISSILPDGITIDLTAKTGRMYGGYTKEMLEEVHPKLRSILEKAGKLVEAPVVGFDLIIKDATKDPDSQHWGIIECNSLPFIDLHYLALEGQPLNLAENVWDLWKK